MNARPTIIVALLSFWVPLKPARATDPEQSSALSAKTETHGSKTANKAGQVAHIDSVATLGYYNQGKILAQKIRFTLTGSAKQYEVAVGSTTKEVDALLKATGLNVAKEPKLWLVDGTILVEFSDKGQVAVLTIRKTNRPASEGKSKPAKARKESAGRLAAEPPPPTNPSLLSRPQQDWLEEEGITQEVWEGASEETRRAWLKRAGK